MDLDDQGNIDITSEANPSTEGMWLVSCGSGTPGTALITFCSRFLNQMTAFPTIEVEKRASASGASGYTPSQIQAAYGFNQASFVGAANGAGQAIAIVDAFDDPKILNDLRAFDAAFGLTDPPSFKVVSQTGSTSNLPKTDPSAASQSSWELEEALGRRVGTRACASEVVAEVTSNDAAVNRPRLNGFSLLCLSHSPWLTLSTGMNRSD